MKNFSNITAVVLVFALLSLIAVMGVGATPAPLTCGDVNTDGDVNIKDATLVQKCVASLEEFTLLQKALGDTDGDGEVTIKDATQIQQYSAGLVSADEFLESKFDYMLIHGFYADYYSGLAMAGVPVTFTVEAEGGEAPLSYEFLVNDNIEAERSEHNTFTYTFPTEGTYTVTVNCYNAFDTCSTATKEYKVSSPYSSELPVIVNFDYNENERFVDKYFTVVANAAFGEGGYQYCFLLDGEVVQDYSEKNTCEYKLPDSITLDDQCVISVRVKDSYMENSYVCTRRLMGVGIPEDWDTEQTIEFEN